MKKWIRYFSLAILLCPMLQALEPGIPSDDNVSDNNVIESSQSSEPKYEYRMQNGMILRRLASENQSKPYLLRAHDVVTNKLMTISDHMKSWIAKKQKTSTTKISLQKKAMTFLKQAPRQAFEFSRDKINILRHKIELLKTPYIISALKKRASSNISAHQEAVSDKDTQFIQKLDSENKADFINHLIDQEMRQLNIDRSFANNPQKTLSQNYQDNLTKKYQPILKKIGLLDNLKPSSDAVLQTIKNLSYDKSYDKLLAFKNSVGQKYLEQLDPDKTLDLDDTAGIVIPKNFPKPVQELVQAN